jgi:ABC-type multidrug transport system fused ATPase/permease subunit
MATEITADAATDEASTITSSVEANSSGGQDLVLKILGVVATGIGILGFVTFFGGAILWVRADRAHLPANDAVAVIPKGVLVTTGASFLVPAVLLALFAVALISMLHFAFELPQRLNARKLGRKARVLRYKADEANLAAKPEEELAQSARKLATDLSEAVTRVTATPGAAAQLQALIEQARAQEEEAEKFEKTAREARTKASRKTAEAERAQAEFDIRSKIPPGLERVQEWVERAGGAAVLLVLPLTINGAVFHLDFRGTVSLIIVAVAAAVISVVTYVVTEKFLWFGVVAFITVGIYIGCATYLSTTNNPKVEPAAALRGPRPPVTGVFIADTPSNLYLGTFANGRDKPPRLLVIPRSQVTDLAVGPLISPSMARKRAVTLALDECRQHIDLPKSGTAAGPMSTACTKRQQAALSFR